MMQDIKKITQIQLVGGDNLALDTRNVNNHLKAGWVILSIGERGYNYSDEGAFYATYLILGHTDIDGIKPEYPLSGIQQWHKDHPEGK